MAFKFENLIVYQKALDLSDYVFELVKINFLNMSNLFIASAKKYL